MGRGNSKRRINYKAEKPLKIRDYKLKHHIGCDEENYCKWKGIPFSKNPYPKYVLSSQKIYYGDYEKIILEQQEKYLDD